MSALAVFASVATPRALAIQANLSGKPSPIWQTNDVVYALASSNGVLYVGGQFTSVRPPGSPLGTGEVARGRLAAFDAATGDLLPLNHTFDGTVRALAISPDGSTLYVGGSFQNVDGVGRNRLAAFDIATGNLMPWRPGANLGVYSIEATANGVYIAGAFTRVLGTDRGRLALIAADRVGTLQPWAPSADGTIFAMAMTKDGSRLVVGGSFNTLAGQPDHAIGSVDPSTGAFLPWAATVVPTNSTVKTIITTSDAVYVGAEGSGGGVFDGTFKTTPTGDLIWINHCLGATQGLAYLNGFLYVGSHVHDCAMTPGGFSQLPKNRGLLAEYADDGHVAGGWFPDTTSGQIGPRTLLTDGQSLFIGGDFTKVNWTLQQGLTRFTGGPDVTAPSVPATPTVVSTAAGVASLSWPASTDLDDSVLSYRIYRDNGATPIATVAATSFPWTGNTVRYRDAGVAPGSVHTYQITARDGTKTSARSSASAPVTIATSNPALSYPQTVLADHPLLYWRLGDSGGSAADASGQGQTGIYAGGTTRGAAGAIPDDPDSAVAFDGQTAIVSSSTRYNDPRVFSLELWFKTTTLMGGRLFGFGNSQLGTSSQYDRHIWMIADGQLNFGVYTGSTVTIGSPRSYNDGQWHHVVATLGPPGMAFYIDGTLIGSNSTTGAQSYSGYWRLGGDNLRGWALSQDWASSAPPSYYLNGTIDELAVYSGVLSQSQVSAHYAANVLSH
jgi:hypothetical protein